MHEVAEDVLALQPLDDLLAGAAADEAGDDHRLIEYLESAGDVDTFAARERETLAGPVAEARLEVGHGERLVDRGVGCDGDDHVAVPSRLLPFAQKPAHRVAPASCAAQYSTSHRLDTAGMQGYVSGASSTAHSSLGEAPAHIEAVARKRPETPTGRTGTTGSRFCPKRLRL